MAVFKCKMCDGQLKITEGMSVCECEYCGTQQTLPKSGDEQMLNMINRANHFRQQCEFDKATEIYEKLISQKEGDAELYWSLVLCRYGIEYVDDPLTKKKIATCHRTQYKSILEDVDYLSALEYADMMQKPVLEAEAKYIDKVQMGILEISNKEDPFDVFICYKESDENGRRTQDSVLAQELYYQLEREGFKVFFSRITLENKLGTQYEPYIFAALNSAKVMVVVGTKPEYFNAVWVKNEWNRYLMIMQEDRTRTLIPAYKDMDPYDLPDALSMFQAQDMSKLGFMQDLIHGIRKIVKSDEAKSQVVQQTVVQNVGNASTEPLLKRVKLFLEDGDWNSAKEYCNRILDLDPECAQAYFYLLMAKMNVCTEEGFDSVQLEAGVAGDEYYKKALRFADNTLKVELENVHKKTIYNYAENQLQLAETNSDYISVKMVYNQIQDYRDSLKKIEICNQNCYENILTSMQFAEDELEYKSVAMAFESLGDFKDAKQKAHECMEYAERARKDSERQEEARQKEIRQQIRKKKIIILVCLLAIVMGIIGKIVGAHIYKSNMYKAFVKAFEGGNYTEAREIFMKIGDYDDTKDYLYKTAVKAFEDGNYTEAHEIFMKIEDYQDTKNYLSKPEFFMISSVGDIVTFGKYTWYIINKTENGCTLLSENIIVSMPYHNELIDITWEKCTLRTWLNNSFYNSFSDEEKTYIVKSKKNNPNNGEYDTDGGNDTEDYVFLLNIDEFENLDNNIRSCGSWWWLRSPGARQGRAVKVDCDGSLWVNGDLVTNVNSVRPALNLKF